MIRRLFMFVFIMCFVIMQNLLCMGTEYEIIDMGNYDTMTNTDGAITSISTSGIKESEPNNVED